MPGPTGSGRRWCDPTRPTRRRGTRTGSCTPTAGLRERASPCHPTCSSMATHACMRCSPTALSPDLPSPSTAAASLPAWLASSAACTSPAASGPVAGTRKRATAPEVVPTATKRGCTHRHVLSQMLRSSRAAGGDEGAGRRDSKGELTLQICPPPLPTLLAHPWQSGPGGCWRPGRPAR